MQKKLILGVLSFGLILSTAALARHHRDKSLYDRLGGKPAITAVVDDFVGRVAGDSRINLKFARSNIDRVKFELVQMLCKVTGGYTHSIPHSQERIHRNMGVTDGEFNALVEDLVGTLKKFNVPDPEQSELLGILGPLRSQIVEVHTATTGTPLPANFKPAPALTDEQRKKADTYEARHTPKSAPVAAPAAAPAAAEAPAAPAAAGEAPPPPPPAPEK